MDLQFITDEHGNKTAAIIPYDEWERTEKAKDILEHVYLSYVIEERKDSVPIWKVEFIPEAREDFDRLDGSVKRLVLKQLIKLEQNPE